MEASATTCPRASRGTRPAARAFHWVMAASMLTLLLTAFLPIAGVKFAWVTWHWLAGLVLTASILFHIIHATCGWTSGRSGWARVIFRNLKAEVLRELGHDVPVPAGKYPLGQPPLSSAIVVAGLSVIVTGLCMMVRVRTPFFTRNRISSATRRGASRT
jgi:cytochrome b subunit of formate dehydrogenase